MTQDNKLAPGALVRLKSGGPLMTYVADDSMFAEAICCWFNGSEKKTDRFPYPALKPAEQE